MRSKTWSIGLILLCIGCNTYLPALEDAPERCGDSIINQFEACDDGDEDASNACTNNCALARCGDGIQRTDLQPSETGFEACDDGNIDHQDPCTNTCQVARCGDGIQRLDLSEENEGFEACDDGNDNDHDNCTVFCAPPRCGDGIVHEGEACDDGNEQQTDVCLNDCTSARCGDGIVHEGEACDDGNDVQTDACLNDCSLASCGDGTVHELEACDDGNASDTDACLSDCTAARCGDGFLLEAAGEQPGEACDDGNEIDGDACTQACTTARCGDGVLRVDLEVGDEGYEACDDGNDDPMDDCSNQCRNDDHGDTQDSATTLTVDGASGRIHSAQDVDYFRWSSPVPGLYRFDLEEQPEQGQERVVLLASLVNADGQTLDQLEVDPACSLEVTLRVDEPVFLRVEPRDEGVAGGRYQISLQTTCGNGVVETHESCDYARPEIGSFSCRKDCEWRRSIVNGWENTCYRQRGVPWCTGGAGWSVLGPIRDELASCYGNNRAERCMRRPIRTPGFDDGIKSMSLGDAIVCMTNARGWPMCLGLNGWNSGIPGPTIECPLNAQNRCVATPRRMHQNLLPQVDGIAVAMRSIFALRQGVIWAWGDGAFGLLGRNTPRERLNDFSYATPQAITMPNPEDLVLYVEGASSLYNVCALTESRALYCWGRNESGQTGVAPLDEPLCPGTWRTNNVAEQCVRSPQRVQGLGRVLDFSVGGAHTCALQEDGALYCWGHNHFGQLGVGNVATCNPLADWQCSATPLRVNLPEVTDVAAGTHHTCAVLRSGRVACWGWGTDHSLGLGREDIVRLPRLLGRINDAREISAGVYHSCVRHDDQRVSCWGSNNVGQTGTSSLSNSVVYPSAVEFRD